VDLDSFSPAPSRAKVPTLLFAADASESRKNLPLLLDAFARLRQRGHRWQLWVAGAGDQEGALAAAPAAAREGVTLLGAVAPAAMASLYAEAWATVLPARAEAFGLVLVESLACGTPVVALDEGGPREIVTDGVGRLCSETADDLADACEEVVGLAEQATTAERCREHASSWDWRTAIVPRLERLYDRAP
jgi:glycosyltransferase involved in cell wall biosynthesis